MSGGGGGAPSSTTTVTKQELPAYAQPYAENLLQRGVGLSQQPYQPYTGQRMPDMAPETIQGLNMTTQRAVAGAPDINSARNMVTATNQGNFLGGPLFGVSTAVDRNPFYGMDNPYSTAALNSALDTAQGRVNNQFNRPGAFGGSAHQEIMGRTLGDLASGWKYNDYTQQAQLGEADVNRRAAASAADLARWQGAWDTSRADQLRSAALSPQLAQQDYIDAQALTGVGDVYGQRQQDLLNLNYNNWLEATNYPYQQMDVLANALAGSTGGRSTTIGQGAPVQYNRAANALGGGLLGYGMGSMAPNALGGYAPYLGAGAGLLGGLAL